MLDTDNFVMYDSNQNKIWQSFHHPTDTILPGQCLLNDQNLFSSKSETDYPTGIFRLNMQSDSNLVQYPVETTTVTTAHAYWNPATFGRGGVNVTLNLDPDGHLYLLNNSVAILLNLTGGYSDTRRLYLAKLDFDGNKILGNGNFELLEDIAPLSFTYAELEKVTNGFQEENGRGSSGTVYEGILNFNNQALTVRRLENIFWYTNTWLMDHLQMSFLITNTQPTWDERIRMALDLARRILCLHEECETQIIHCDIRTTSNVLIDQYRLWEEKAVLQEWVHQCFENKELAKLIIDLKTDKKFFERMVRVGLCCNLDEPSLYPDIFVRSQIIAEVRIRCSMYNTRDVFN
ncbi:hypothetical protein POM88_037625 [Heracleum sosnowskyi]|uniref:Bulb-type lectin domain-containing protein n=1 Tax=Heracleum sosnowskyi TaxID=360622 RepID=A0AAD8HSI0_9APIA|nr:hypothetical protein POM88_037625 [Heracleum sosnowskyi]